MLTKKIITVSIDKMTFGGRGLGRHEEKIVFVEGAIPGDIVDAQITTERPAYLEAVVESLRQPSPTRLTSPCQYSDTCGGCQWLNVPYETGVSWKRSFIEDAFTRVLKLKELPKIQMHPSPETNHYRNRILLRGTVHSDGQISLGYLRANTWDQVPIQRCYIADPALNSILAEILAIKLKNTTPQKFRLELQTLPYQTKIQKPHIFATVHPLDKSDLSELTRTLKSSPLICWAGTAKEAQTSPATVVFEESEGLLYHTSPGQFQQVNLRLNNTLRQLVRSEIQTHAMAIHSTLDLFCGSGNLSLGLANCTGIEVSENAIRLAKINAKVNGFDGNGYSAQDACKAVKKFAQNQKTFDAVILDPPRAGFKEGMSDLKKLKSKYIFYVSCDPMTLARDLKELLSDYKIVNVHGFDFFPHTYHVETLVKLEALA